MRLGPRPRTLPYRRPLIALLLSAALVACGGPPGAQQPDPDPDPDPDPVPTPTSVRMNDASCTANAYSGVGLVADNGTTTLRFPEDGTPFGTLSAVADASVPDTGFDGRVVSDVTCTMIGSNAIGVSGISAAGTVLLNATEGGSGGGYAGGYAEYRAELRVGTFDDDTGSWSGDGVSIDLRYLAGPGIRVLLSIGSDDLVDSTAQETGSQRFQGTLPPGAYALEAAAVVDLDGASLRDGATSFEIDMTLR